MKKVFYGWYILIAAMFMTAMGSGVVGSLAIFLRPLAKDNNFTFAQITPMISFYFVGSVVGSFLLAKIVNRSNLKIAVLCAGLLQATATFFLSKTVALPALYSLTFLIGAAVVSVSILPVPMLVTNWFHAKRGLAMGSSIAGLGLGSIIFAPVLNLVLAKFGYETGFVVWSVLIAGITVIVSCIIYTKPEEKGLKPYGLNEGDPEIEAEKSKKALSHEQSLNFSQAIKTPTFWLIILFMFGTCIPQMTELVNTPSYLASIGFSAVDISKSILILGLCSMTCKVLLGHLFDKIGLLKGALVGFTLGSITLMALIFIEKSHYLIIFSTAFAGGGLNFNLILLGLFVAQYFGTKHYATIYSVCYTVFAFMAALFVYISGILIDNFGYRQTYIFSSIALVIGIISCVVVITHKKAWITEPVENK